MSVRAARLCFCDECHVTFARYSYAYFHNLPQADLPYIKIPLHTVIKLTPKAYGCDEER
jgi:6-phosphofructo-2-kinase/fructose-2,6-biphosphatase 2